MGEVLRSRVLRALGLGQVWVQLEALSARLRRLEQDVVDLQQAPRFEHDTIGQTRGEA